VNQARITCVCLVLFGCLCLACLAWARKKLPGAVKVYLLSHGQRQHHGYRDQAFYLAELLENTGRFEVTLGEDAAILEMPAIRKYALIIANADRRDPEFKYTKAQQQALLEYVRSGGGYVSIHGADNAAPDWLPEWKQMLGGVFSHVGLPDGKVHQGSYWVRIVDKSSPITRGITDFPLKAELYYNLQMQPGVEPLATVEFDGTAWPVAWTRTFGSGRVFHLVLGHGYLGPAKDDPVRLIIQGVTWVAAAAPKAKSAE
jgi:hypothetical protein